MLQQHGTTTLEWTNGTTSSQEDSVQRIILEVR